MHSILLLLLYTHSILLPPLYTHIPVPPSPSLVYSGLKERAITEFCNLILHSLFQAGLHEEGHPRGRLSQKVRLFRCRICTDLGVSQGVLAYSEVLQS